MSRPGWTAYFLGIADAVSARADCQRAQLGAVLVKDRRIVSTGYNGSPPGGPSCLAGECPRAQSDTPRLNADYSNCIALHAETNCLAYSNRADCVGATIYVTGRPCDMCKKLIVAAGIACIVYRDHLDEARPVIVDEL